MRETLHSERVKVMESKGVQYIPGWSENNTFDLSMCTQCPYETEIQMIKRCNYQGIISCTLTSILSSNIEKYFQLIQCNNCDMISSINSVQKKPSTQEWGGTFALPICVKGGRSKCIFSAGKRYKVEDRFVSTPKRLK